MSMRSFGRFVDLEFGTRKASREGGRRVLMLLFLVAGARNGRVLQMLALA